VTSIHESSRDFSIVGYGFVDKISNRDFDFVFPNGGIGNGERVDLVLRSEVDGDGNEIEW
jgi:hypothetical protein